MKELSRNIVIDLLPLYISGEVSPETSEAIKQYLEKDPEMAETAKEMAAANSLGKAPIPFNRETALETYNESKKWMTVRVIGIMAVSGVVIMCFFTSLMIANIVENLTR